MIDLIKLSKIISHALRHEPHAYNIKLENEGWVLINELSDAIRRKDPEFTLLQEEDIYEMVISAKKRRHEIKDGMIRAMYGHSAEININYPVTVPPVQLYHGTSETAAEKILSEGIKPMNRLYVHLSSDKNVAYVVGSRKDKKPVILKVNSIAASQKGINFYSANKDTWLSEFIPPDVISRAE